MHWLQAMDRRSYDDLLKVCPLLCYVTVLAEFT